MKKSILKNCSLCMILFILASCGNDLKDDYEYEAFIISNSETPTEVKEPVVNDVTITDITKTSANCMVSYTSTDLIVQTCGVCYSSSSNNPTINDATLSVSCNDKNGSATISLTGLNENTTYYVRPYVKTSAGTTYGNTVQFTTAKSNTPDEGDNPTPSYYD